MPTSPTPAADRSADQLRAAAERARKTGDPLHLVAAGLLEVAAQSTPVASVDETARAALAVARQLLGTGVAEGDPEVVAYRNTDRPGVLLCREHGKGWLGLTPLTSEDLEDGGFCTWGREYGCECGRDVLITPPAPTASLREVVDRLVAHAVGFQDVLDESDRGPWGALILADIAELRALANRPATDAAPPAPADRAALTETEQQLLGFALEMAEEEIHARNLEIPDKDRAALTSLRRLAADAAAGVQPPTTTADRAADLGMTPTEYRQHSHTTAVQQIQAAAQGLFAGTAIRVADALREPGAEGEALTDAERRFVTVNGITDEDYAALKEFRANATPPAAPAAPEEPTR